LNNSTVLEMTRKVPLSTEALMNIGGIGEQKVKEHGVHIVATIWSFLQRNNLLSLFPKLMLSSDHPPYDLPLCPTWRDPMSLEAENIRASNAAASVSAAHSPMKVLPSSSALSSNSYRPYPGFGSSEPMQQRLFGSPVSLSVSPPGDGPAHGPVSTGMYTHHSRPGVAPNLKHGLEATPPPSAHTSTSSSFPSSDGNTNRNDHPYMRYLNQREGGRVTPIKRSSPSEGAGDDHEQNRRRLLVSDYDNSSHIADPTYFLVSPDN
jgi:hypothetical protein